MSRHYAEIAFTRSVQEMQTRQGSRKVYAHWDDDNPPPMVLGERERAFIEARDSFYQATVNGNGWPYVQYRGGPVGFLKVLDNQRIGYADFRGNVQYISVGNMMDNDRTALILMDYVNRHRLKIYASAKLIEYKDNPELVASLENVHYRARVERAVILTVQAFDWNCPQHITPRYTQAEIERYFPEFE